MTHRCQRVLISVTCYRSYDRASRDAYNLLAQSLPGLATMSDDVSASSVECHPVARARRRGPWPSLFAGHPSGLFADRTRLHRSRRPKGLHDMRSRVRVDRRLLPPSKPRFLLSKRKADRESQTGRHTMRSFVCAGTLTLLAGAVFAQSGSAPKFDAADVHVSPKAVNAFMRTSPARNGRYEIKNATMLDLVRTAYGFNSDTILGGPNWLELDRFDVIAKVASGADAESQKAMLQSLLEDRFKLVARKETKPIPTWVLAAGKQHRLKEADGSGPSGCRIPDTTSGALPEGGIRLFRMDQDGKQSQIILGAGGVVQYSCRNMTMAAFAAELRGMLGPRVGQEPVIDDTGLKGAWNFDVKWSIGLIGLPDQGEQIPVADAIDKQLGLKLEQRSMPKQVLVIDSVSRTPAPNPANVAELLPATPAPKEFEVADVKLAAPPSPSQPPMISMQMQPGGRFTCRGCPMRLLLTRAFNTNNNELLAGVPAGIDSMGRRHRE